jgi:hypothetical protein
MMSTTTKTTLLMIVMMIPVYPLFAQHTGEEMEQDLRISESILEEMFDIRTNRFVQYHRGGDGVAGQYIPGYGIHFRINAALDSTPEAVRVNVTGHAQIERAEEPDSTQKTKNERAIVEERFMDYFKNYASLLRNIPDSEFVRLSFGVGVIPLQGSFFDNHHTGRPTLTAWARMADIRSFTKGTLAEPEFENRIQVEDLSSVETPTDQDVFRSILETAMEKADVEHIQLRRTSGPEYLNGFGLSYQVSASLSAFPFWGEGLRDLDIRVDSLATTWSDALQTIGQKLTPMAVRIDSMFNPGKYNGNTDSLISAYQDSIRESTRSLRIHLEKENLPDEVVRKEISAIHDKLADTVADYGHTLRSLDDEELLMITIHWNSRHPEMPIRSELRIRKSELISGTSPEIRVIGKE